MVSNWSCTAPLPHVNDHCLEVLKGSDPSPADSSGHGFALFKGCLHILDFFIFSTRYKFKTCHDSVAVHRLSVEHYIHPFWTSIVLDPTKHAELSWLCLLALGWRIYSNSKIINFLSFYLLILKNFFIHL